MKAFAAVIIVSMLATNLLFMEFNLMAKANPPPGIPIITIYSPYNQTYNSNLLILNISVYSFAGDFGNRWIGFSLDNGVNTTISTTKDGTDTQNGLVYLPFLSNGVHSIIVYAVYNFSGKFYNSDMTPYIPSSTKTVSFVIEQNSTSAPSSTNPPTTPTVSSLITSTPTVPEFQPALAFLIIVIATTASTLAIKGNKLK
jgi:hypothetical protein